MTGPVCVVMCNLITTTTTTTSTTTILLLVVNDRDSRENGEGVTSRTQEKERSNDRVEEVDEVEVGNGKRKRQDSASPLSRLI